jgi:hypothetical protein
LLGQIASLVPQAAKTISRFVGDVTRVFAHYATSATGGDGKGGQAGTGDAEIPPSLPATGEGKDRGDGASDASDFASMFLAPVLAPRPRPHPRPRVLRRLRRLTEGFMAALRAGDAVNPAVSSPSERGAKASATAERQSQFMRQPRQRHRADKIRYDFNHPKPPWIR